MRDDRLKTCFKTLAKVAFPLALLLAMPGCSSHSASGTGPGSAPGPSYVPMVVYQFDGKDSDTIQAPFWASRTQVDPTRSLTGSSSLKISFLHGINAYGFTKDLPVPVLPGESVWMRMYLYFPSTLSFSFGNDVSQGGDGFGWNKFFVLSQRDHLGPRMYLQPPSPHRRDYGSPDFHGEPGILINHDGLGDDNTYCILGQSGYRMPRDQWFSLQMHWQVRTDNTAFVRVWSDEQFLGECPGAGKVGSGYAIQNFGMGDYWNGGAWVQGASSPSFWVDSIVITKETPTRLDAGGRPFIHPSEFR